MKFKFWLLWQRIRVFFSRERCLCGAARGWPRDWLMDGILDDGGKTGGKTVHSTWGCYPCQS